MVGRRPQTSSFPSVSTKRHRGRGVRAAAVHPGGIQTELGRHIGADELQKLVDRIIARLRVAQNSDGPK
jgi:NAD(P)-dependent dehydrogenase (short-subunit alcohol dehydrogenase family)